MTKAELTQALCTLHNISVTSGEGSQQKIMDLLRNNDTPALRYLLQVALSPFIVTGINKVDVYPVNTTFSEYSMEKLIDTISSRAALTDELREEVCNFINSYDFADEAGFAGVELRRVLAKVITKSLNIGIGAKMINKAFNEKFLPISEVMLAEDNRKEVEKWSGIKYAEVKENGNRMVTRIKGTQITFFTRNFKQLDNISLSNIEKSIRNVLNVYIDEDSDFFLDGEIVHLNDVTDEGRKVIGGLFNKIIKGTGFEGIDEEFTYRIFDWEFNSTLEAGIGTLSYEDRRNSGIFDAIKRVNVANLQQRDPWIVQTKEDIKKVYMDVIGMGGEGLIVKKAGHLYELKRSKNWIKYKEENECDLLITGILEGKEGTKRTKVGKLSCESACGALKVNVGSGLSDEQIALIEQNPGDYIGKVVTILYNVRICNKQGEESLFLPRFKRNKDGMIVIRHDKNEADRIERIK